MVTIKSRKDLGTFTLYLLLAILGFLVFAIGVYDFKNPDGWRDYLSGIFFCFIGFIVPLMMFYAMLKTYYVFEEDGLVLRSGIFNTKIPYGKIYVVKDSRRPLSFYSLSVRKLELTYKDDSDKSKEWTKSYISPIDREEFIKELKKHCKAMKVVRSPNAVKEDQEEKARIAAREAKKSSK